MNRFERHDGDFRDASSEEIRSRIRETRAAMDETLDELAHRFKPRTLLEELAEIVDFDSDTGARMRSRAGDFGRRFVRQIESQPVPAALVGIGLAWMAFGPQRDPDRESEHGEGSLRRSASAVSGAASKGASKARSAASSAKHAASSGMRSTRDAASSAMESVRSGAAQTRRFVERSLHDSPLALGAGAVALGLLCGLALPRTRQEDELMGEASDDAMERAKASAERTAERAKDTAGRAAEAAADAASDEVRAETQRSDPPRY